MDRDVLYNKIESLRRCLNRVESKTPGSSDELLDNIDLQDIISVNLERAVQNCVDIASHLLAELEYPAPDTMSDAFRLLQKPGIVNAKVAQAMIKAVGFRNTVVHAYQEVDWRIVFAIATERLGNFRDFACQVLRYMGEES